MIEEIKSIIETNEHLEYNELSNRVVCTLTGHEILPTKVDIERYLKGKKFNLARTEHIYQQYNRFLLKTKNNELYCELTCKFITYSYKDIYNHINGYNFIRACENWFKCKEENLTYVPITTVRSKDSKKYKSMLKAMNLEAGDEESEKSESDEENKEELNHTDSNVEGKMETDEVLNERSESESDVEVPPKKRKRTKN